MEKVRGTQTQMPLALEFGKDTVYKRKNIIAINEENFKGWEYEEKQYTYPEYVALQQAEADNIKLALAEVAEMAIGG